MKNKLPKKHQNIIDRTLKDANKMTLHMDKFELPPDMYTDEEKKCLRAAGENTRCRVVFIDLIDKNEI